MNRKLSYIRRSIVVLAATLAVAAALPSSTAANELSAASVRRYSDGTPVPVAWSRLARDAAGASVRLRTSELPAGTETTLWWIIFNSPRTCAGGSGGARCGMVDLWNEEAAPSVVYGTHRAIGRDGRGEFAAELAMGDTADVVLGSGLTNPQGAEIHLRLVSCVCYGDPSLVAGAGQRTCANTQYAIHRQ